MNASRETRSHAHTQAISGHRPIFLSIHLSPCLPVSSEDAREDSRLSCECRDSEFAHPLQREHQTRGDSASANICALAFLCISCCFRALSTVSLADPLFGDRKPGQEIIAYAAYVRAFMRRTETEERQKREKERYERQYQEQASGVAIALSFLSFPFHCLSSHDSFSLSFPSSVSSSLCRVIEGLSR